MKTAGIKRSTQPGFIGLAIAGIALVAFPFTGRAGMIWDAPRNITSDTDVSTTGTLVAAFNFGSNSPVNVNGVLFGVFNLPGSAINDLPVTAGPFTATPSPGTSMFGAPFQVPNAPPFINLPGSYRLLLSSGGTDIIPGSAFTLSINGLTAGHTYQFEWWANDSLPSVHSIVTATDGTSVTLNSNVSNTSGGLGQFVTGTFVSNGAPESIVFSSAAYEYINAFQLRDITGISTPQSWRQAWYGNTANSGNAADTADPYHKGIANLAVFAFLGPNQNPATALMSQLPQPQKGGGNFFYSFTPPAGVSGVSYGAQYATSLNPTNWQTITDSFSGGVHTFSVPIGANAQIFLRLTVSEP